jgi:DNA-binding CsgD family transcriptional regulator
MLWTNAIESRRDAFILKVCRQGGSDESSDACCRGLPYTSGDEIVPDAEGRTFMELALRQADLARLEQALTTILSPLTHEHCDDWRLAVESSVADLLDGDHVVFGIPRAGIPMHVHAINVAAQPQRAIQTLFGQLPDLPPDPWLQEAERERLRSRSEVWSRLRAFWRAAAGRPAARRDSPFLGEVLNPGRIYDSENIDWSVAGGHVALCVSYSNSETSVRSRRASPRGVAASLLRLLLPALKAGVIMRLAHDHEVASAPSLARLGLTRREAQVARLLARRATNREIAEQLGMSPHTVRHHTENVFAKLGVHSRRALGAQLAAPTFEG